MKYFALLLTLVCLLFVSCSSDRAQLREGMLGLRLRQSAFLDEWGKPDRTHTATGDEVTNVQWSKTGGGFYKGKHTFEVWTYESRKTELTFNYKHRLVGWTSQATVKELAKPEK